MNKQDKVAVAELKRQWDLFVDDDNMCLDDLREALFKVFALAKDPTRAD